MTKTQYGPIIGVDDSATSGTYHWLGVPFAKPPVGALRWKAPVDPDSWIEPRVTQKFGNACAQIGRIFGPGANNTFDATIGTTLNQAVGDEDCLYLNIWRPATNETDLPVIFFIHGGSNLTGYTADPWYNGANLAKSANAVVVTTNYRLGIFGWLGAPQLRTGENALDDSGNFGTLDTIKALQFVQKNIAAFGGNAGNVTITGESAGGLNVLALMASPLTQGAGLFHRAAIFSGGISQPGDLPQGALPALMSQPFYAEQSKALINNLLIADGKARDTTSAEAFVATQTEEQIADYLRSKTPAELFKVLLTKLTPAHLGTSNPIPEGTVFPSSAIAAFKAGNYVKVPLLIGNMRDEGKLFQSALALAPALGGKPGFKVDDATRFDMMCNFNPDAPSALTVEDLIDPAYLPVDQPETGYNARLAVITNLLFIANRDNMINALQSQQSDIWYYQLNWDEVPAPWNDIYGAAHGFDLPFWFGNFVPNVFSNVMNTTANQGGRVALSRRPPVFSSTRL